MNTDKKLLLARAGDLVSQCERGGEAKFSQFLDGGEAAVIEDEFRAPYGVSAMLFGGYEEAERKILGIFPEWEEADSSAFPICAARFDAPKFRTLSHRDYLGTLMSLGIDRAMTGDILTDEGGAYILLRTDIAEYVINNMTKIANSGVKGKLIPLRSFTAPKPKTQQKSCVAASLRLDAVIAAAFGISRAAAEKLVKEERVKINHRETLNRSAQLEEGDLISVRGQGRFILSEAGRETQKGRLHIEIQKFI